MSIKRQVVWSMAPLMMVTALNLFSVRLFYKYLGVEMYALWFYVITFSGMFGFADLGLGVAVGRYIGLALGREDHEAVREYWATGNCLALPLVALMALAFSTAGILFGPKWFNVSPQNCWLLRACFAAAGFSIFCSYYGQFWNILLQAHLKFRVLSMLQLGMISLGIIPTLIIAYHTHNPLLLICWSVLLGTSQLAFLISYARRHFGLGFNLRMARWARAREMATYTGKTFATLVFNAVFGSIDRFVLGRVAPPAGFAHYTIASNVGMRLQSLSVAVMGPVFHNTSRAIGAGGETSPAQVYNHTFDFMFGWYILVAVWACLWHPLLLRLWLGKELGAAVAPVFCPIIIAYTLTAIANISGAQLGPLNRLGTGLLFNLLTVLLLGVSVYGGWRLAGVVGVAYAFLVSRLPLFAQDIFVIRLIGGGGWLRLKTWLHIGAQCLVGAAFAASYLIMPRISLWLIVPVVLHGGLVAVWLAREPLRKWWTGAANVRNLPPNPAPPVAKA